MCAAVHVSYTSHHANVEFLHPFFMAARPNYN